MLNVDLTNLLGKCFELGGRGPNNYDCWGLCLEVGKRSGVELPEKYTPAEMAAINAAISDTLDDEFVELPKPESYCIVIFKMPPPIIWHTGIVLPGCKTFIHIMRKRSVAIERLKLWKHRIDGFYKYNGLSKNTKSV